MDTHSTHRIAGAFLGGWLFELVGPEVEEGSFNFLSIFTATGGAVLLFLIIGFIAKARKKGKDSE